MVFPNEESFIFSGVCGRISSLLYQFFISLIRTAKFWQSLLSSVVNLLTFGTEKPFLFYHLTNKMHAVVELEKNTIILLPLEDTTKLQGACLDYTQMSCNVFQNHWYSYVVRQSQYQQKMNS
jgi:hypothetical protein